ncbi:hypothetical protein J2Z31_005961 [Sinorhizobium kostiense]|uniref:Transposase n=1 Tax=Sinorhizobium kostiense TaxID=76747 RepID=A0ABS4RAR0_9HYPH|nr:hypothetical protein [Sinorhizobium kostiense]
MVLRPAVALAERHGREHQWPGRKRLSREVDPLSISDGELKDICDRLNSAPRKCLGYRTPAEVLRKKLLAQTRHVG